MAIMTTTDKKLVMKYQDKGSYTFDDIVLAATDDQMYALANALNAFQSEKPPAQIISVVTKQII